MMATGLIKSGCTTDIYSQISKDNKLNMSRIKTHRQSVSASQVNIVSKTLPDPEQCPHSTLNLVNKTKVSPIIYKLQERTIKRQMNSRQSSRSKHMDLNQFVQSSFTTKTSPGFTEHYKQFPRRVVFHKNRSTFIHNTSYDSLSVRTKSIFDLTTLTNQTIEMNDVRKAQIKVEGTPFNYSAQTQRRR